MKDLTEKCRLCLKVAQDSVNLFKESKGVIYSDIILNFLEIEVQDTPNWPSNACPDCIELLDKITIFQSQIVSSHKALYAEIHHRRAKRTLKEDTEDMPKRMITSTYIETHEIKHQTTESFCDEPLQLLSSKPQVIQDIRSRSVVRNTTEASPKELQLEVLMNEMRIFTCHLCQTDFVNFYNLRTHVRSRHCLRDYQICCDQSILISPSQIYEHFRMHLDDKVPLHGDHLEQMLEVSSPISEDIPETSDFEVLNPKTEPNVSVPIEGNNMLDSDVEDKSGHPLETNFDHPTDEESSDLFESESDDDEDFTSKGTTPDPTPLQQPSPPKNWTQLRKVKPSGPRIKGRTWSSVVRRGYNPTPEEEKLEATMNEMKIFVCRICETDTGTMFQLRDHVKQDHSQEKYEVCCHLKITVTPAFLYEHIRLHLNKEAFQCKECGKNFKTSQVLQVHQTQMHPKGLPTNICEVCGKGSYTAKQHQTHMLQHMDKQFKCTTCGKEYTQKTPLDAHIKKVHQLQNDFLCDICGKGFPTNAYLLSHIGDHAGPHGGNRKKKTKPKAHPSHFGDEYFQ